jgi:hypothetical protein
MKENITAKKTEYILPGLVFFMTVIGLAVRLAAPLQASFPLNDGGLFYAMIIDLQETSYTLPLHATYNSAEIPFAYPPLAFYLTGLLSDLLQISVIELVRVLPAIVSALTIPAFYFLAREITDSKVQIVFGVFAFALLPRDFAWLIMGGGITRSFGMLFAMLTMTFAYRFYNGHSARHLLACILLGTLTILTHPEATVHAAITALIFYLWKDRSWKGFGLSLAIGVGILVLTAPWWGTVIARHGIGPFQAAMTASGQDNFNPLIGTLIFLRFLFTNEPFLPILSVLGLIGIFASLSRRQTFLPAWIFLLHLIEPRGGTLYMMIPLALLIGEALETVIIPVLNQTGNVDNSEFVNLLRGKVSRYFLVFLFVHSTISAYSTSLNIQDELSLKQSDLDVFAWVRENTPVNAQFLLLTGQLPLRDAWSEWFPVLSERQSQATIFGYEWVNDGQFGDRVEAYENLQACAYESIDCLDNWHQGLGGDYSYVYLWNLNGALHYPLSVRLLDEPGFDLVYQSDQSMIFNKVK